MFERFNKDYYVFKKRFISNSDTTYLLEYNSLVENLTVKNLFFNDRLFKFGFEEYKELNTLFATIITRNTLYDSLRVIESVIYKIKHNKKNRYRVLIIQRNVLNDYYKYSNINDITISWSYLFSMSTRWENERNIKCGFIFKENFKQIINLEAYFTLPNCYCFKKSKECKIETLPVSSLVSEPDYLAYSDIFAYQKKYKGFLHRDDFLYILDNLKTQIERCIKEIIHVYPNMIIGKYDYQCYLLDLYNKFRFQKMELTK